MEKIETFEKWSESPSMEDLFYLWLDELVEAGYVLKYYKHKDIQPYTLSKEVSVLQRQYKTVYKGTPREKTTFKDKKNVLLRGITYTPDVLVLWADKAAGLFYGPEGSKSYFVGYPIQDEEFGLINFSTVDVKAPPGYGNKNSSDKSFTVKRAWVKQLYNVIVNKCYLMPVGKKKNMDPYLFASTFTPLRYFYSDGLTKLRTISNFTAKTLKEYVDLRR